MPSIVGKDNITRQSLLSCAPCEDSLYYYNNIVSSSTRVCTQNTKYIIQFIAPTLIGNYKLFVEYYEYIGEVHMYDVFISLGNFFYSNKFYN